MEAGLRVKCVKGDYHGYTGTVIDRQAWEALVGKFENVPDWAVFVRGDQGSVAWFSSDELEVLHE